MNREQRIAAFLASAGFAAADAEPLAQDASFRRYLRLRGRRPAVLMDAPPPEDVRPFLRIAACLRALGLSVPDILAADAADGLVLEEDLGDDLLSVLLDQAQVAAEPLLDAAVDALVALQRADWSSASAALSRVPGDQLSGSKPTGSPPLQTERRLAELHRRDVPPADTPQAVSSDGMPQREGPQREPADWMPLLGEPSDWALPEWGATAMTHTAIGTLFDWWWPARFGSAAPDPARRDIAQGLQAMLAPVAEGPRCLVHRDYFAGNLLWLPRRAGVARIGILDFQGAALGHPAYDLVSLVQDARRDMPDAVQHRAISRYLAARPELEPNGFRAAFAACAAQRHLRVACQWVRLALRDQRPQYLRFGPRTWRLLDAALHQPAAAPLSAALDRWLPAAVRGNPPDLAGRVGSLPT